MSRQAEINVKIELDERKLPATIQWRATDGAPDFQAVDALLLSLWDPRSRTTLSFDLWTAEMTIDEMNFFVLERLFKLAETHRKATGSGEISKMIEDLCRVLTDKLETDAKARLDQSTS